VSNTQRDSSQAEKVEPHGVHAPRVLTRLAGASLFAVSGCTASTDPRAWPSKAVRVVVPFGAGNSTDLAARLFASLLAERWGQAVVVDNRTGGDGTAGVQAY
jgi:tripartite-type tricarboxylate transporter receptor subunit TctC